MSRSDFVNIWRTNTKRKIIEGFGGGCCVCGYNKCFRSLHTHHINSSEKDFGLGSIMAHPISWGKIVIELKKCVLICSNCHGEFHSSLIEIPKNAKRFDESLIIDKNSPKDKEFCFCGKEKPLRHKFCSLTCSGRYHRRIDWDNKNVAELLRTKSVVSIARELNCSDSAVHKRMKKIGLK